MRAVQRYGLAGLLGVVGFVSALALLHLARPDVDWARHYVSAFANGPLGSLFVFATAAHGIGNLALDAGLRRSLAPGPWRAAAVLLFGLAAAGIVVAALFPADSAGRAATPSGRVHFLAAAVSFPLELIALVLFSVTFARNPAWRRYAAWSFGGSAMAAVAVLGLFSAVLWGRVPGLAERVGLGSFLLWECTASLALLRTSRAAGGLPTATDARA